ncbi:MAG TPA: DJ-1/PfpI family protein, partial [Gemmatales bacterium]|nr:DJ-1/PfpI family protein [Gemmatales bacterium]
FFDSNTPAGAICHGLRLLPAARVLTGRKCTGYPAVAPEIVQAGGEYVEVAMNEAYGDHNLISAPAWPAHPAWLSAFQKLLTQTK